MLKLIPIGPKSFKKQVKEGCAYQVDAEGMAAFKGHARWILDQLFFAGPSGLVHSTKVKLVHKLDVLHDQR